MKNLLILFKNLLALPWLEWNEKIGERLNVTKFMIIYIILLTFVKIMKDISIKASRRRKLEA